MNKIVPLLFLSILFSPSNYAQKKTVFKIQLQMDIVSNQLKVYGDRFASYLLNEMAKIPDVEQVDSSPAYYLRVTLFGIPCNCSGYDFYYRAHFFKKDFKDVQVLSPLPFTEGFKSTDQIEALAKDIVAALNLHTLQRLR
jgi:ABC-type glycerol-3-phosphate transport system substrate-binding protein